MIEITCSDLLENDREESARFFEERQEDQEKTTPMVNKKETIPTDSILHDLALDDIPESDPDRPNPARNVRGRYLKYIG